MKRLGLKALQYCLVLWAAVTLNFLLPHLAPGSPIDYMVGEASQLDPSQEAELLASYGMDQGVAHQYWSYWGKLLNGDLGISVRFSAPVLDLLIQHIPWTLLLMSSGIVVSTLVGGIAGAVAAVRRGSRWDIGMLVSVIALDAMPGFLVALALVAVFSVELGWLPSFGALVIGGSGVGDVGDVLRRLILPATALAIATLGSSFLLVRGSIVSLLEEGFIRMAEAKGLRAGRIFFRHLLRNALLPVTSNFALRAGAILSGAVIIETVFAYPGIGRLVYEAVLSRDYPLLRGAFLLSTIGVILANLAADLVYPVLDPRSRVATGVPA